MPLGRATISCDAGRMTAAARQAADNNAQWCDTVCRARDVTTSFGDRVWSARARSPQGYPDAVTLDPAATVDDVLSLVDRGPGCSVKDSFAALDLRSAGFTVMFGAQWVSRESGSPRTCPVLPWQVVTTPADLAGFAAAHGNPVAFADALLDAPDVRILAATADDVLLAGALLNRTGRVIGVSNLFSTGAGTEHALEVIWSDVVVVAARLFPGAPLVGYETAQDLPPAIEAGFRSVGPLRVWIRG